MNWRCANLTAGSVNARTANGSGAREGYCSQNGKKPSSLGAQARKRTENSAHREKLIRWRLDSRHQSYEFVGGFPSPTGAARLWGGPYVWPPSWLPEKCLGRAGDTAP